MRPNGGSAELRKEGTTHVTKWLVKVTKEASLARFTTCVSAEVPTSSFEEIEKACFDASRKAAKRVVLWW
jgi:hypothetical protein